MQRLASKASNFEVSWAHNLPLRIPQERFEEAYQLAVKATNVFEQEKFPAICSSLLATFQVEKLSDMIIRYGHDCVVAGLNLALEGGARPHENHSVIGWSWFENHVATAARDAQCRADQAMPRRQAYRRRG